MEGMDQPISEDPVGDVVARLHDTIADGDDHALAATGRTLYHRGGENLMHRIRNAYVQRGDIATSAVGTGWENIGAWSAASEA
jgi:hypothetical protein